MLRHTLLCSVLLAALAAPGLAQEKPGTFVLEAGKIELGELIDRATAIRLVLQNDVPPPEPKAPGLAERLAELEQRLAALEEQVRALQGKGK